MTYRAVQHRKIRVNLQLARHSFSDGGFICGWSFLCVLSRLFFRLLVLARAASPRKERAMPYLSIQTNVGLEEEAQKRLLTEASKLVATNLNKPEKYVMVAWTPAPKMTFDSNPNGAAFLELRSIGIPEASRQKLPGALAKCMSDNLGIDADRVYLVMMDVPGKYWAEGEQTFG
jgi:phenylpyruvate tautomerase PptA (4-oxalocrotonate tautomerase family)